MHWNLPLTHKKNVFKIKFKSTAVFERHILKFSRSFTGLEILISICNIILKTANFRFTSDNCFTTLKVHNKWLYLEQQNSICEIFLSKELSLNMTLYGSQWTIHPICSHFVIKLLSQLLVAKTPILYVVYANHFDQGQVQNTLCHLAYIPCLLSTQIFTVDTQAYYTEENKVSSLLKIRLLSY